MRYIIFLLLLFAIAGVGRSQELRQNVKGRIADPVTGHPLPAASIVVERGDETVSTTRSDEAGNFALALPVGRYKVTVSFTGYETVERELLVIAGKESILNFSLPISILTLQEVEVAGTALPDEVPGMRSLTIEKTLRFPANFFDPVRVATAYPGVVAANDQGNSIIVRGNSPNGLLWRLNGLDIVNPNHLANAGTLSDKPAANGGGVNILSAQMLDRTDFYMGMFPVQYGNALSGIVDMSLRHGNNEKFEHTAQASLIGLDIASEGPLVRGGDASYLANYRYSTVGLLSKAGVNFGDEAITFQDLSLNISNELRNGSISLFGFWGNSVNDFRAKAPEDWVEDKDRYDILYTSDTYAIGVNYAATFGQGKFFAGMAYSNAAQERTALASEEVPDDQLHMKSDDFSKINGVFSTALRYETMWGSRLRWQIGSTVNHLGNEMNIAKTIVCVACPTNIPQTFSVDTDGFLLQPFTSFYFTVSPAVSFETGLRYVHYTYNGTSSMEPRAKLSWKAFSNGTLEAAYGLVSQLQLPQVYGMDGNSKLGFTRAHHIDINYAYAIGNGLELRPGIFYQYLFDVPIENALNSSSKFSALNLLEEASPTDLVNEGTGKNYGADVTIEKHFYQTDYFLFGASYYDSRYTGADGTERDTRFNGGYTLNAVYGREWVNDSKNRVFGLNARALYLGGMPQYSVLVTESMALGETVYSDTYAPQPTDPYFRVDLRLSFRKNKPGYTRTFALDIQNLTGQQNAAYQYYDFVQARVVNKFQLGIIPVLVYRIDF